MMPDTQSIQSKGAEAAGNIFLLFYSRECGQFPFQCLFRSKELHYVFLNVSQGKISTHHKNHIYPVLSI